MSAPAPASELERLKAELQRITNAYHSLDLEFRLLGVRHEALFKRQQKKRETPDNASYESQINTLRQDKNNAFQLLQDAIATNQMQTQNIRRLQHRMCESQQYSDLRYNSLMLELNDKGELAEQVKQKDSQIQALMRELAATKARVEELTPIQQDQLKSMDISQKKIDELSNELKQKEKMYRAELAKLNQVICKRDDINQASTQTINSLEQKIQRLYVTHNQAMQLRENEHAAAIKSLQKQISEKVSYVADLKRRLTNAETAVREKDTTIAELRTMLATLLQSATLSVTSSSSSRADAFAAVKTMPITVLGSPRSPNGSKMPSSQPVAGAVVTSTSENKM